MLRPNVGFWDHLSRDEDLVTPRTERMENGTLFSSELKLTNQPHTVLSRQKNDCYNKRILRYEESRNAY